MSAISAIFFAHSVLFYCFHLSSRMLIVFNYYWTELFLLGSYKHDKCHISSVTIQFLHTFLSSIILFAVLIYISQSTSLYLLKFVKAVTIVFIVVYSSFMRCCTLLCVLLSEFFNNTFFTTFLYPVQFSA